MSCAVLRLSGEKLWWADQGTDQIGTCDKKDGGNWKVLRNSTSPMMHMKIYNETVQKGAGRRPTLLFFFLWSLFVQLKSNHIADNILWKMCCCDCHEEPVYPENICSPFCELPFDFAPCVFL